MIRDTAISTLIFGGTLVLGSSDILGQTFGLEYSTEWQTDFSGGYDWLNLLQLSVEMPINKAISLEATSISVAKTGESTLIDDMLTFSNIEAGNIPLTLSRLGFGIKIKEADLFVGINNVNEDYFTSDLTSFFTNSSCGISPTISCNYDIANYPLAAWCLHYRQQIGDFAFQTSIYPGQGYYRLAGHNNLFSLDVKRDGVFSISSIDYKKNGIYCVLGAAIHYGMCIDDEERASEDTATQKKISASPWFLTEINLPCNLGLHAHASFATVKQGCKAYAGIGAIYSGKRIQPGIAFNYASFSYAHEYEIELCARVPVLSDMAYIQPTLHMVATEGHSPRCIGMFRFCLTL